MTEKTAHKSDCLLCGKMTSAKKYCSQCRWDVTRATPEEKASWAAACSPESAPWEVTDEYGNVKLATTDFPAACRLAERNDWWVWHPEYGSALFGREDDDE